LRPWTLWEAGIARGLDKPLFVIVYEPGNPPKGQGIFNRLGTPLDALQQTPGMDAGKIRGVLDNLARKINKPIAGTQLEDSLRKYITQCPLINAAGFSRAESLISASN
jgi:hypothetical protein